MYFIFLYVLLLIHTLFHLLFNNSPLHGYLLIYRVLLMHLLLWVAVSEELNKAFSQSLWEKIPIKNY